MPHVVFRPTAKSEAIDARDWYDEQAPGLGLEFTRALDATLSGIQRFPESFPFIEGSFRQAVLRRFPYSVIYEFDGNEIVVLRCFHHRRDPNALRESRSDT